MATQQTQTSSRLGMTKRRVVWIGLAALGALVVAGLAWSAFGPTTIVLTAPQLQERINRALPREFKGVTVERASVTIADEKVALRVEARARALGQMLSTAVSARGVPRYEPAQGAIFFDADDVKIENVALGGVLAERLSARLGERETMLRNAAVAGVEAYLGARPVYHFKDDLKGIIGRAALGDISVKSDAIVITVSVARLTTTVAIGLAVLLVIAVVVIQLIRHPRWGSKPGTAQ
jgi:hypothetical protein